MKKENGFGYQLARFFLSPIYKLMYHPIIIGKENLMKMDPKICKIR